MRGQPRWQSWLEASANVLIGYGIAIGAQIIIFPLFGIKLHLEQNLEIGALFTLVSMIRSYVLRRVFNAFQRG